MGEKNNTESHIRTIQDVLDLFEPFLTVEDIQEVIEELADMRGEQDD